MAKGSRIRRKYFVDRAVQGSLIYRLVRYWLTCLAALGCLTMVGWIFVTPGIGGFVGSNVEMAHVVSVFALAILASLLMLPLMIFDLMRFTNRFAGPMLRLRRAMHAVAAGKAVEPIYFRDGDFWDEIAEAFNGILARIESDQVEIATINYESPSQSNYSLPPDENIVNLTEECIEHTSSI